MLNSGGTVTKSCKWLRSRKERKSASVLRSCKTSRRDRPTSRTGSLFRSSSRSRLMHSKLKPSTTSKRRTSTPTPRSASRTGRLRARTSSLLSWNSKTTRSVFFEETWANKRDCVSHSKLHCTAICRSSQRLRSLHTYLHKV